MHTPLATNGMAMTTYVMRTDRRPVGVSVGTTGIARWTRKVTGTPSAKRRAEVARPRGAAPAEKVRGHACTSTAPAVLPSRAAGAAGEAEGDPTLAVADGARRESATERAPAVS